MNASQQAGHFKRHSFRYILFIAQTPDYNQIPENFLDMNKPLLTSLFLCLLIVPTAAQNRSRVFDNFDTKKGVDILTPTVKPIVEYNSGKKLVKKTVQSMAVNEGVSSKNKNSGNSVGRISMAFERSMGNFTTGDGKIDSYIVDSSQRYDIDPLLIYAQMHQESSFKLRATSYKGASGLMQLMPATARRFGVTDIYNPKQNIEAGVKYMRWLLDTFGGDVGLALAGYNAGEGAVMKYRNQVPPYRETQEYVRRISERYVSIKNPNSPQMAVKVSNKIANKLEKIESAPLTMYEPNALTIRTPDGRLRLVNQ